VQVRDSWDVQGTDWLKILQEAQTAVGTSGTCEGAKRTKSTEKPKKLPKSCFTRSGTSGPK
ncbi:hypothetical protein KI387_014703, partial [Taxus chinensis]